MTASQMFGVPVEGMPDMARRPRRSTSASSTASRRSASPTSSASRRRGGASDYIDTYFERFPGIRDYMDTTQARRASRATSRRSSAGRCMSRDQRADPHAAPGAERAAINAPIQGTGADIIKRGDGRVPALARGLPARMLLQVHDELVHIGMATVKRRDRAARLSLTLDRRYLASYQLGAAAVLRRSAVAPLLDPQATARSRGRLARVEVLPIEVLGDGRVGGIGRRWPATRRQVPTASDEGPGLMVELRHAGRARAQRKRGAGVARTCDADREADAAAARLAGGADLVALALGVGWSRGPLGRRSPANAGALAEARDRADPSRASSTTGQEPVLGGPGDRQNGEGEPDAKPVVDKISRGSMR